LFSSKSFPVPYWPGEVTALQFSFLPAAFMKSDTRWRSYTCHSTSFKDPLYKQTNSVTNDFFKTENNNNIKLAVHEDPNSLHLHSLNSFIPKIITFQNSKISFLSQHFSWC